MKDTILIVDDEKILGLMDKMLSKNGFKTLTTKNGVEGLKTFKENMNNIKLIIVDEQMPLMSGSAMMEEIIKIEPNILTIFVTGKSKIAYEGSHHMLKKPFNIIDLINLVKILMDSHQPE